MYTKDKIEVMQAFLDGKRIQFKRKDTSTWKDIDCDDICLDWNWSDFEYRIKSKSEYRPYKDIDEMIEDYKGRAGIPRTYKPMVQLNIWVMEKTEEKAIILINMYNRANNEVRIGNILYNVEEVFEFYTYLDGSPVGKKVE